MWNVFRVFRFLIRRDSLSIAESCHPSFRSRHLTTNDGGAACQGSPTNSPLFLLLNLAVQTTVLHTAPIELRPNELASSRSRVGLNDFSPDLERTGRKSVRSNAPGCMALTKDKSCLSTLLPIEGPASRLRTICAPSDRQRVNHKPDGSGHVFQQHRPADGVARVL